MERLTLSGVVVCVVGVATTLLGGWDVALQALIAFMIIDYMAGLVVAGAFKRSGKSDTGALSSSAARKGIYKKVMQLAFVVIGYFVDTYLGTGIVRNGVILAFMSTELLSIIEHAGVMGVPLPPVLGKALDLLQQKKGDANV